MVAQLSGALTRAFLVALLVAIPSLVVPTVATDASQIAFVLALITGSMVFFEYYGRCPSIVEFRFAPPYNRLKFIFLAFAVLVLSIVTRGQTDPGSWSTLLTTMIGGLGALLDFPYSPVRLIMLLLPHDTAPEQREIVRLSASVCYALSLVLVFTFLAIVRLLNWPVRRGAFNMWLNLPLFDPTGGGDVVQRLNRDVGINIALGFLLPFLLPGAAMYLSGFFNRSALLDPQTLIWMTCIWAFVPASMIMRGIAMNRIADLITAKRRRAYARAEAEREEGFQTV